jgi:hypothetical protein
MGHRTRTFTDDRTVSTARARFSVSWNEEHVGLVLETHSGHVELPSRAFSYLLLQLGRALDADLRGGIPAGEAGWMYAEDLAAKLHSTVEKINVDVHRARQALAATGMFGDPEAFIERRRGSGQMRIRVGEIVLFREPSSPAVGHGA